MTAWPAEQMAAHGGVGILAVVLLPALEAALPVIGALLPGRTAVVSGGMLAWQGHVTVEAALLTALTGAVLGNLAGYAIGRRWKKRVLAPLRALAGRRRYTERALRLIERRGTGAVFVGRFTTVLRTLVPTLCGATRMAPAALSAVVRGQQRGVGPGVRAHRLCHRACRTRVTSPVDDPRSLSPRQPPAIRNAGPGAPAAPTTAAPTPAPRTPNPPSRPGAREDRHRTSGDR
ncbi:DedA family protein [Streptomyces sp. NPDC019531]|uniref:DedA family protein n=1 Tax=Streptomyces sp. NPDC019531 TaxID=3365062 RepID=UPI00384FC569